MNQRVHDGMNYFWKICFPSKKHLA